jgi:hypothetical protein
MAFAIITEVFLTLTQRRERRQPSKAVGDAAAALRA